jgi:preprotein translocase subunit SecD
MINKYPAWKHAIILIVLAFGILYSVPNFYGELPAVLITNQHGYEMDANFRNDVKAKLEAAKITPIKIEASENRKKLYLHYRKPANRAKAVELLKKAYIANYYVNQITIPDTPDFLKKLKASPLVLGLDLRGGVHAVLDVDMDSAINDEIGRQREDLRTEFQTAKKKIRFRKFENIYGTSAEKGADGKPRRELNGLYIEFINKDYREAGFKHIKNQLDKALQETPKPPYSLAKVDRDGKPGVEIRYSEEQKKMIGAEAIKANIKTIRRRVDALGVAEPVIVQQGETRIVVQLPGVQDPDEIWEVIGKQATVQAHGAHSDHFTFNFESGQRPPSDADVYEDAKEKYPDSDKFRKYLLKKQVIWSGDMVEAAQAGFSSGKGVSTPAVHITLNAKGADRNYEYSKRHIKQHIGIVYIDEENTNEFKIVNGKKRRVTKIRKRVINFAQIQSELGKRFEITGLSTREARHLALFLTTGALKARMIEVESRTIGASLGAANVQKGINSIVAGFVLVLLFMIFWYRVFGLVANVALIANLVILIGCLSIMHVTLTLPGIAGIVLTVGMAVDANVLIYERIREELRLGNSPQASIHTGYEKAFATIADANITTFIAALALLALGSGPVRGFAITLAFGIVTSMFTAIMMSRAIVNMIYGGKTVKTLSIK